MRVGILAGGLGSRLAEETETKPKPMVEIGGRPILWHIIRYYSSGFGFDDFVVALGYKGEYIKRWMVDYAALTSDLSVDMRTGGVHALTNGHDRWQVSLIDTGQASGTGGRIRRLAPHLAPGTFILALGDGLYDLDIRAMLEFHQSHGRLATVAAVRPGGRFGHLELAGDRVAEFSEKPQTGEGWINGGVWILEPGVVDYIDGDPTMFELEPMHHIAKDGELMAFRHHGFWQCMDTLRDRKLLEDLWAAERAPWKVW